MNTSAGEDTNIWSRRRLLGYPLSLIEFSRVAAPLLAGFSLTAVVELVGRTVTQRGFRGDLAILAFSTSAALLIFALQAGLTAATYQTPPAERLAWYPEARYSNYWARLVRDKQWQDESIANRYRRLTRTTYNLGVVSLLLGFVAILWAPPGEWNVARVVAVGVMSTLAVYELIGTAYMPGLFKKLYVPEAALDEQLPSSPPEIDARILRSRLFGQAADEQPSAELDGQQDRGKSPSPRQVQLVERMQAKSREARARLDARTAGPGTSPSPANDISE